MVRIIMILTKEAYHSPLLISYLAAMMILENVPFALVPAS